MFLKEYYEFSIDDKTFISQWTIASACDYVYYSSFFNSANREHFGFSSLPVVISQCPERPAIIMCRFKDGEIRRLLSLCANKTRYNYIIVQTLIGDDGYLNRTDLNNIPPNVARIYSKNIPYSHPNLIPIPIGRDWRVIAQGCSNSFTRTDLKAFKNLAYMNFSVETNSRLRDFVYRKFSQERWVTTRRPVGYLKYEIDHCAFVAEMHDHIFSFSPIGRAIDCYRTWDALFAKSIPVIDDCPQMRTFERLPVIFTKDWSDISERHLRQQFDRLQTVDLDVEPLFAEYWKRRIRRDFVDLCT